MADETLLNQDVLTQAAYIGLLERLRSWSTRVDGIKESLAAVLNEGVGLQAEFTALGEIGANGAAHVGRTCDFIVQGAAAVGYTLTGDGLSEEQRAGS